MREVGGWRWLCVRRSVCQFAAGGAGGFADVQRPRLGVEQRSRSHDHRGGCRGRRCGCRLPGGRVRSARRITGGQNQHGQQCNPPTAMAPDHGRHPNAVLTVDIQGRGQHSTKYGRKVSRSNIDLVTVSNWCDVKSRPEGPRQRSPQTR